MELGCIVLQSFLAGFATCGKQEGRRKTGEFDEIDLAEENGIVHFAALEVGPDVDCTGASVGCAGPDSETYFGGKAGKEGKALVL